MLNKDFASVTARIAAANKPEFAIANTPDLGMDFANAIKSYTDNEKKQKLINALQGGDPEQINIAAAAYDPQGQLDYIQRIKQARADADLAFQRQKEMADYNHALDMKKQDALYNLKNHLEAIKGGYGTAAQQNASYLQGLGYTPEESAMMVFGGQNPTLNLGSLGKKGLEAHDKKIGEDIAERQIEARKATEEYNKVSSDIDRIKELLPQAKTEAFIDRKTPTMFFDDATQEARGELRNLLGGMRLDQMQYMKGAISDKEQEFLRDVVSGDLTKYTPPEIRGVLNSIDRKARQIKDKFAQQSAWAGQKNWGEVSDDELLGGL